jgi:hypothetical protein
MSRTARFSVVGAIVRASFVAHLQPPVMASVRTGAKVVEQIRTFASGRRIGDVGYTPQLQHPT